MDPRDVALDDLFEALAIGVKSYYEKTGAFRSLGIALSGGRDSMLTLLVAWRAAQLIDGGTRISAFYMPSRHSQQTTKSAAHILAEELGVTLQTISIDEATDREIEATTAMLGGAAPTEATRQNVQARLRGQRMWNWANSSGALFLQTGDMSEKAVGYTTIGGDLEGALSVIANVPKTVVISLLQRLWRRFAFQGIAATLRTDPGPELADAQVAERELMPFPVLDACLHLYATEKMSPPEVATALASPVSRRIVRVPPGLGGSIHHAVLAVDLQVGPVTARPSCRFPRPRPRARAAVARRAAERVGEIARSLSLFAIHDSSPPCAFARSPCEALLARQALKLKLN